MTTQVYIKNIPARWSSLEVLLAKLESYGTVVDFRIYNSHAFVEFQEEAEALAAVDGLKNSVFDHKKISLQISRERHPSDAQQGGELNSVPSVAATTTASSSSVPVTTTTGSSDSSSSTSSSSSSRTPFHLGPTPSDVLPVPNVSLEERPGVPTNLYQQGTRDNVLIVFKAKAKIYLERK